MINPSMSTLLEGITSLSGVVSLLMAEKVHGFEDPERCLEAIISKDLPNHLSLHVPMGYTFPKILAGRFIQNPVSTNEKGDLVLSDSLLEQLRSKRPLYLKKIEETREFHLTGHSYPLAKKGHEFRDSGISILSQAFLHIFKSLSAA